MRSWLTRRGARAWLLHVLAALVLLTQQAGLQHGFQHERRDENPAVHSLCKVCLGYHATDHAVASQPILALASQAEHALAERPGRPQCATAAPTGFLARAPPAPLI